MPSTEIEIIGKINFEDIIVVDSSEKLLKAYPDIKKYEIEQLFKKFFVK